MSKQETVIVKVEDKMKADLKKLADASSRDFSDYIRRVFEYAIDKKLKV